MLLFLKVLIRLNLAIQYLTKVMTVSIVIPNYNGEKLINKNLANVIQVIKGPARIALARNASRNDASGTQSVAGGSSDQRIKEIIIVDDASKDGSIETISKQQTANRNLTIILLQNKKNLGFSSTVNRGIETATGDVVVLLNTDVVPEENFLKAALPHFNDPLVFAVGFLDKSIEGNKTIKRGRGIGYWNRGFVLHKRGEVDQTDTFWVSCGSGAFRRDIWNKLNGLDELYNPFYWEDIDLSYRAQKSGYRIIFEPKSIVIHEHGMGSIKSHYSDKQVTTIAYRNQFYFVWKNITDGNLLLSHFFWLPNHIFHALLVNDTVFFSALFQAILHLPTVILHRRRQKKLYKRSDIELLTSPSEQD